MIAGSSHKAITLLYATAMLVCSVLGLLFPWLSDTAETVIVLCVLVISILFTVATVRRVDAGMTQGNGATQ